MGTLLLEILETAAIAVSGFLIKKYVFLEPDMEAKKQRFFYLVSFFLIGIVFLVFGKDGAAGFRRICSTGVCGDRKNICFG